MSIIISDNQRSAKYQQARTKKRSLKPEGTSVYQIFFGKAKG